MQKILIFGDGQLGTLYRDFFNSNNYQAEISKADITKEGEIQKAIAEFKPDIIINTAAKTNTDWCEENKIEAFKVNTLGADNVAKICLKNNIHLIHMSSGCIFESINGQPVFTEEDSPVPVAFYSQTKAWGDELILNKIKKGLKALILRPRLLLTSEVHPRNILYKMSKYSKFHSNENSMTTIDTLLKATYHLIEKNQTGIFNITNSGTISPLKIAQLLKEHINHEMNIEKSDKEDLDKTAKVKRVDAIINTKKLESTGFKLNNIDDAILDTILKLKENLEKSKAL